MTQDEIQRMDDDGENLLRTLVSTFPHGVTLKNGTLRSAFCTEKPHSIVHSGRNYRFMGRCKNYNTSTPETRHKETKRKAHSTRPTINFQLACPSCRAAWTWRQNDTCLSSKTKEVSQVCSQRSKKSAHTYAKCALLCHFVLKRSAHGTFVHLRLSLIHI